MYIINNGSYYRKVDTMGRKKDYSEWFGKKHGKLKIIKEESLHQKNGKKTLYLICECDCGNTYQTNPSNIVNGKVFSCGCAKKQRYSPPSHGMSKTRFYKIWMGILKRCGNANNPGHPNYGGRGITVCDKWIDFIGFKDDMYEGYEEHVKQYGESDTSIERINVNGNYTKDNCTWATRKEQNTNTRQVKHYEYKGELLDLAEIARREGINYRTLRGRILEYGWTLDMALERSQLLGTKKRTLLYNYKGKMLPLKEISKLEGIGYTTMFNRVKNIGLSLEDALNKEKHKKTR